MRHTATTVLALSLLLAGAAGVAAQDGSTGGGDGSDLTTRPRLGGGGGSAGAPASAPAERVRRVDPRTETLQKMSRPMTVTFRDDRLEDVIEFFKAVTDADIQPIWLDDSAVAGLDKDTPISLEITDRPAIAVLQRVLKKASDEFDESTWQLTPNGALQIGPKTALNEEKRVQIYDVRALVFTIRNYSDVPELDLDSVLQQGQGGGGGGGGGGGSIFGGGDEDQAEPGPSEREEIDRLVEIIVDLVEPEQWFDNGGNGGTIRQFRGNLIVNAPDYVHRALDGYRFPVPSAVRNLR